MANEQATVKTWGERDGQLRRLNIGLSPGQKLLLLILHGYVGQNDGGWPGQAVLAEHVGVDVKSIQRYTRVLCGEGGRPVLIYALRPGETPPAGVPNRRGKAKSAASIWYVINWDVIDELSESPPATRSTSGCDNLSGADVGAGVGETATGGADNLSHGDGTRDRGGDRMSGGGGQNVASGGTECPVGVDNLSSDSLHQQPQEEPTTTTTRGSEVEPGSGGVGGDGGGGGDSPDGEIGGSVVAGMLRGVGVWPDAARRLAGLGHCDGAYAEATIASVRASGVSASDEPERFGSLVAARIDKAMEPTKAGRDLVIAEREAAEKRRLAEGRGLEKRIAERSHAEAVERERAAWRDWNAAKRDEELAALRERFIASLPEAERAWWETRDPRGGSLGMKLMELETP